MSNTVVVSAAQMGPCSFKNDEVDKKGNVARIVALLEAAIKDKVKIICFPELSLTNYFAVRSDRDYQKFVDLADSTFRENQYAVARGWYNRALAVKSDEQYPKDQLTEIEVKIAERMTAQSGEQFETDVQKASAAFGAKNYNVARFWYKKALELRPNDAEVKSRLIEIEAAIK